MKTVASFYCDSDFILIGTNSRTCEASGSWSEGITRCEGLYRYSISQNNNSSINSLGQMTFEKLAILKVVMTGAMNLALRPSVRCRNI